MNKRKKLYAKLTLDLVLLVLLALMYQKRAISMQFHEWKGHGQWNGPRKRRCGRHGSGKSWSGLWHESCPARDFREQRDFCLCDLRIDSVRLCHCNRIPLRLV